MPEPERGKTIANKVYVLESYEKQNFAPVNLRHLQAVARMLDRDVGFFDASNRERYEAEECLLVCSKTGKVKGYCLVFSKGEPNGSQ